MSINNQPVFNSRPTCFQEILNLSGSIRILCSKRQKPFLIFFIKVVLEFRKRLDFFLKKIPEQTVTAVQAYFCFVSAAPVFFFFCNPHSVSPPFPFSTLSDLTEAGLTAAAMTLKSLLILSAFYSPHAGHSHFVLRYFNEFLSDCFPLFLISLFRSLN